MPNKYNEIVKKIESLSRFGKASGREVTECLLPKLGRPDQGMRYIHVAGTNGKGSVALYIASALTACGYRCGLFTSPHLVTIRERIAVDGEMISEEDFTRIASQVLSVDSGEGFSPTFFDVCLLTALIYFKEKDCDYVVLEAGIGGRLDSTRGVIEPPVCAVITSIGLDHTAILGDTVEQIAWEKAGIEREGVPVVIAHNLPSVRAVIEEGADRYFAIDEAGTEDCRGNDLLKLSLLAAGRTFSLKPPLAGDFQYDNEAAALAALSYLGEVLDPVKAVYGIKGAHLPARIERLRDEPLFIVDGSHNPQAVGALSMTLDSIAPGERFVFVIAAMADKDARRMVMATAYLAECYLCVRADDQRGLGPEELCEIVRRQSAVAEARSDTAEALQEAASCGKPVAVFGSLYLAGEVHRLINEGRLKL